MLDGSSWLHVDDLDDTARSGAAAYIAKHANKRLLVLHHNGCAVLQRDQSECGVFAIVVAYIALYGLADAADGAFDLALAWHYVEELMRLAQITRDNGVIRKWLFASATHNEPLALEALLSTTVKLLFALKNGRMRAT